YFSLNGVAQATQQDLTLSAAQLAQLTYHSGSGADVIWAQASAGTAWSNWISFTVSAPVDPGPTVSASNQIAAHGQSFAASSLVSASDPFGDQISQYLVWDAGNGGAHLSVNGVAQASKQNISLTAAQFAQTTYQSGSGTDLLWVQAYDGYTWSPWVSFTVMA